MTRLVCLVLGLALLLVSNGHIIAPFASIASAALILVFIDGDRPVLRLAVLAPLFALAHCFIWDGVIPLPGVLYFVVASVYGLAHFLPYVMHRLFGASQRPFVFTLVFPSAYVVVEALIEAFTPYGSWSSLAYTQDPASGIGQLAAFGGIGLVTFGLTWLASILAWPWAQPQNQIRQLATVAIGAAVVLTALSGLPVLREDSFSAPKSVVTLAGLSSDPALDHALLRLMGDGKHALSKEALAAADALNSDLSARTRKAADRGAKIVAWSEAAARILKPDETRFLHDLAALAHEKGIYLFAAYGTFDPVSPIKHFENRVAAIAPTGGVIWIFDKAHPVAGSEASFVKAGAAKLLSIDTPFGRIGVIICHDADFPAFVRQARMRGVDLLINPVNDWAEIQDLHANMARYRAVENGLTLARVANGVSLVADPAGRVQARRNSFAGEGLDLIAVMSVRSTALHWSVDAKMKFFAIFALLVLAGLAFLRRPLNKKP